MAAAFEAARGDLAERILAAMDAAQADGGDLRGQQTAALLIVDREPVRVPLVDIRVDHHPRPLDELRRMLRLHRAYSAEGAVAEVVAAGDLNAAQTLLDRIGALAPDEPYLQYLRALHLAAWLDAEAEALDILRAPSGANTWRAKRRSTISASRDWVGGCSPRWTSGTSGCAFPNPFPRAGRKAGIRDWGIGIKEKQERKSTGRAEQAPPLRITRNLLVSPLYIWVGEGKRAKASRGEVYFLAPRVHCWLHDFRRRYLDDGG